MSGTKARGLVVLAVSLIGCLAAPAAAQDGSRIARACIEQVREVTTNHVQKTKQITVRTVHAINSAAEEGAPPRVLTEIARTGKQRVETTAERGHHAVREIAQRCVRVLVEAGASEEVINSVKRAARRAHAKLDTTAERATHAISKALSEALG